MHLYSYRGVTYTLAPASLNPSTPAIADPLPPALEQEILEQDIFTAIPQTQTPNAVIPMRYRGSLYMLERFSSPSSTETCPKAEQPESCRDESPQSAKQESTQSLDD